MNTIGDRIKYMRKAKGLSMSDISLHIGINKASLSSYENNKYDPSAQIIVKLCELLQVSADWLLTGKENTTNINAEMKWELNEQEKKDAEKSIDYLSEDIRALVVNYQKLDERDKQEIRIIIAHKIRSKPEGLLSDSLTLKEGSSGASTA